MRIVDAAGTYTVMVGREIVWLGGAAFGGLWAGSWGASYGTAAALGAGFVGAFVGLIVAILYQDGSLALTRATACWPRWAVVTIAVAEAICVLSLGAVVLRSIALNMRHVVLGR